MVNASFRRSENARPAMRIKRRMLWAEIEAEFSGAVICKRCGTNLRDIADKCIAYYDETCEGYAKIGEAHERKLRELRAKLAE